MMSQTRPDNSVDEAFIVDYCLGALPEDEESRFEERYLADDQLLERLSIVEDALIDAYIRDQLSPSDRARFEMNVLGTPRGSRRVAMAKALHRWAEQEASTARRWQVRPWLYGTAAASLVAVSALVIASRQSVVSLPSEESRSSPDRDNGQPADRATREAATSQPTLLEPGVWRSAGRPVPVVRPHDGVLRLALRLRAGVTGQAYGVTIQDSAGKVVWAHSGPLVADTSTERLLQLTVPAENVASGDHVVILRERSPNGRSGEEVDEYAFTVSLTGR